MERATHMCVVCANEHREGLMRRSGFKCGECIGKRSKSSFRKESRKREALREQREHEQRKQKQSQNRERAKQAPEPSRPISLQEMMNNKGSVFEPKLVYPVRGVDGLPPPPPHPKVSQAETQTEAGQPYAPPTPFPKVSVACSPIVTPDDVFDDSISPLPMHKTRDTGVGASPVYHARGRQASLQVPPHKVHHTQMNTAQTHTQAHAAQTHTAQAHAAQAHMQPLASGIEEFRRKGLLAVGPARPQLDQPRRGSDGQQSKELVPYPDGGRNEYIEKRAAEMLAVAGFNGRDVPPTFNIDKLMDDFNVAHDLPLPFKSASSIATPQEEGSAGDKDHLFTVDVPPSSPKLSFDSPAPRGIGSAPSVPLHSAEPQALHALDTNLDPSIQERRAALRKAYNIGHTGSQGGQSYKTERGFSV